ncbi:MAG: hypothetical protein ACRD5R_19135 [Candidatus Acidiferrales bacterium]
MKLVLMLSHGNATLESGFSVNKSILVENLKEYSLIAQRQVYDAVKNLGGIELIQITNSMRKYVKNAYQTYNEFLENSRKMDGEAEKARSGKEKAKDKISFRIKKKKKLRHNC